MSSSKLWLSLVLCSAACGGSSFHSGDASGGSDATGATSSGGDSTSGGQVGSGGGTGHAGSTGKAGSSGKAGESSGGSLSSGGDTGSAGTSVSSGGDLAVGGDMNGGGAGGSASAGTAGTNGGDAGSGGGVDCSPTGKLWLDYLALYDKANACEVAVSGECVSNSNIVNQGNCPLPVNEKSDSYDAAKKALQAWRNAGCEFKITMCQAQIGALTCVAGGDTPQTGNCKYSPIIAQ